MSRTATWSVLDEVEAPAGSLTENLAARRLLRAGHRDGRSCRVPPAALRASAYEGWLVVERDQFLTQADTPTALALQARNRAWLRAQGY
ncbi:MAG: hypothetical protein U0869_07020 [Chloroflexota bacterium]